MSLNSLASSLVDRERKEGKREWLEQPEVGKHGVKVGPMVSAGLSGAPQRGKVGSDDHLGSTDDVQNALSALVEYVPAETITLYLATVAALPALGFDVAVVYWSFAGLTPLFFALIYAGKRRAAGESRWPKEVRRWPWWPMIAASVAFLIWGLTVPGGPYLDDTGGRVLSGLLAIMASTLLGVVGRVVAPKTEPPFGGASVPSP